MQKAVRPYLPRILGIRLILGYKRGRCLKIFNRFLTQDKFYLSQFSRILKELQHAVQIGMGNTSYMNYLFILPRPKGNFTNKYLIPSANTFFIKIQFAPQVTAYIHFLDATAKTAPIHRVVASFIPASICTLS